MLFEKSLIFAREKRATFVAAIFVYWITQSEQRIAHHLRDNF